MAGSPPGRSGRLGSGDLPLGIGRPCGPTVLLAWYCPSSKFQLQVMIFLNLNSAVTGGIPVRQRTWGGAVRSARCGGSMRKPTGPLALRVGGPGAQCSPLQIHRPAPSLVGGSGLRLPRRRVRPGGPRFALQSETKNEVTISVDSWLLLPVVALAVTLSLSVQPGASRCSLGAFCPAQGPREQSSEDVEH
jgi:hypothetical protein